MLPLQGSRFQAKGQAAFTPELQPIFEDRQADRRSLLAVVAMAEGIHQRFTQGRQRDRQLFLALQAIPGNARRRAQVALAEQDRFLQQLEGMAVQLPLIQKLSLVGAAEAGQTQLALGQHSDAPGEQHLGRQGDRPIAQQLQPLQGVGWIAEGRLRQAARLYAYAQGAQQFLLIQISRGDSHRLLGFPALDRMAALQLTLQYRLGHAPRAAGDPFKGAPVVKERSHPLARRYPHSNHPLIPIPREGHFVDRGLGGRFDPPQRLRQFTAAGIAAVLPHDPAAVAHPEQHRAASAIEEGTEGVASGAQLAGGAFELQLFGFSGADQGLQLGQGHRSLPSISSCTIPGQWRQPRLG